MLFLFYTTLFFLDNQGSGVSKPSVDSDLKLFIETIEHKILLLHSKRVRDAETHFENNKIIYGLNLLGRFKKIKNKLIDNI